MSNFSKQLAALNDEISSFVVSAKAEIAKLHKITCKATMFAVEHGQYGPLTRLAKELPTGHAEAVRVFFVNMISVTGIATDKVDGKGEPRKAIFLTYSKTEGYKPRKDEYGMEHKKLLFSDPSLLDSISMEKTEAERERAMSAAFDVGSKLDAFLMTLAKNDNLALAKEIHRVAKGYATKTIGDLEQTAKDNSTATKVAALAERAAKFGMVLTAAAPAASIEVEGSDEKAPTAEVTEEKAPKAA